MNPIMDNWEYPNRQHVNCRAAVGPLVVFDEAASIPDEIFAHLSVLQSGRKVERKSMKHKITVAVCLVAIAAGLVYTVPAYHRYQAWRAEQNAKATAAAQSEAHKNAVQQAIFNAGVDKLEQNCAKDKANYAALPAATKAKTPAPQCDVNLVQ